MAVADQLELALHIQPAVVGADPNLARAKLDRRALQYVFVDRPRDARLLLVSERLDPAPALAHAQRSGVGGERDRGPPGLVADVERRLP